MSKSAVLPGIHAVAAKLQASADKPTIHDTLRKAAVFLKPEVITTLQASAAEGKLTVKEADKLLTGLKPEARIAAKAALHYAGLLKG